MEAARTPPSSSSEDKSPSSKRPKLGDGGGASIENSEPPTSGEAKIAAEPPPPPVAKDNENGDGSGTRMGENQQICDADQEEPIDGHSIDVEASLDLMGTMEQDLQKEVGNADLVMIDDQEKDLEKETEMGTKEKDGDEEAKSEKPKKKKRSKKGNTPTKVDALVANNVVLWLY
ncbi:unnamed protein product [Arabidopsis lyrata]|uniref:uncharacterized protein LOC9309538 isoform X1 n=1 Tax=Arabidopsis lyrata subsp. lyrata TaxID=81972 RepID=UPI000A29B1C4|nr:uncharacterized protein LOC9309538 isoform X1 [Arabidopsis lyrata subsp. lyrata]CAH8270700.1 unnamed protein product [Arabidopsis lyrata]|eukprot:XP_020876756.1 uncharacterized protein LOC9309538 isoform X1 [Arabidopsis lyrata subsp. lyrata]